MNHKWLRIALPALGFALAQCTASSTTTSGPPPAVDGMGDTTFGPNKTIVTTSIDPTLSDFALAVAIQPDNKIVVGGSNGFAGQGQVALVRYNEDGSLVRTTLGSPAVAAAVKINQPVDSKIVVAALMVTATTASPTGFTTSIVVLRY